MIRKFTITRIAPDFYTIGIEELEAGRWDIVSSMGGRFPEYDLPAPARARDPHTPLKQDGAQYTFYACVYSFPEPRLMGKFADYSSAYGWDRPR